MEGPAAYVITNDEAHANRVAELVKVLKRQHVEVQQLTADTTANVPGEKRGDKPKPEQFPAGSIVVRMDQPYSRAADALLDRQYWAPDDPQKHPYDDTGWSFSALFNLKVARIADPDVLKAAMKPVDDPAALTGKLAGSGSVVLVPNTGQTTLLALVYKLKGATIQATDKPFDAAGHHFAAGSLLISRRARRSADGRPARSRARRHSLAATPTVFPTPFTHRASPSCTPGSPRRLKVGGATPSTPRAFPTTTSAPRPPPKEDDLRSKYDVIVFAPVGRGSTSDIINGIPSWSNAMPWEKSDLTPNLGSIDSTSDVRPGLGYDGLAHLKKFVEQGGLLITCEDTAQFAIETGLAPGVTVAPMADARVVGSVLNTVFVARDNPIANGYDLNVPVISANGMAFNVTNTVGRAGGRILMDPYAERPTGRGSLEENDEPQGRRIAEAEPLEKQQPWQARKLNEEQMRNNPSVIPAPIPARGDPALRRRQVPASLRPARQGSVHRRARSRRRRPPRRRQRAPVRQQPHLPRRNHRHLRPRLQRHPQPRPSGCQGCRSGKEVIGVEGSTSV